MTDQEARDLLATLADYCAEYEEDPDKMTVGQLAEDLAQSQPRDGVGIPPSVCEALKLDKAEYGEVGA